MGNKLCFSKTKTTKSQSKKDSSNKEIKGTDTEEVNSCYKVASQNLKLNSQIASSRGETNRDNTDIQNFNLSINSQIKNISKFQHSRMSSDEYIINPHAKNKMVNIVNIENSNMIILNKINRNEEDTINTDSNRLNLNTKNRMQYNENEFILGRKIGQGRFGQVYSGLSGNTGEIIAIKFYKIELKNPNDLKLQRITHQLEESFEKLKSLDHPNIINYLQTDKKQNLTIKTTTNNLNETIVNVEFNILNEFCNGGSIKTLIERFGELDEKVIKKYTKEILEALDYLYQNGIKHRYLKSTNILVDGNGTIRISDILIESIILGEGEELKENLKQGSEIPYWISPQTFNSNQIDLVYVDLWSVGCLIIEMSTKKSPWQHYSFASNEEFINFIVTTNLFPTFPKKLSKYCHDFLHILFSRNPKNKNLLFSIKDLLNHEFFTNNDTLIVSPAINKKASSDVSSSIIPKMNGVVNILNSNKDNTEDAALFSMTVTVGSSQVSSINNNILVGLNDGTVTYNESTPLVIDKKVILEEEHSREYSPKDKFDEKKNIFEFFSEEENSYCYANQSNRNSVVIRDSIINKVNIAPDNSSPNKFSNCNYEDYFENKNNIATESIISNDVKYINSEIEKTNYMEKTAKIKLLKNC